MKRILFLTNYASPYRVRFFDELGQYADVTVLYSESIAEMTHRDSKWFESGDGGFHPVQLTRTARMKTGNLCLDVVSWLKKKFDIIIVAGYSSPTVILAMAYMRAHKIPFWMEVDGGLIRPDSKAKFLFKKTLVTMADRWLSTGKYTTDYLVHYGADRSRVAEYPFTSLYEKDILHETVSREEKLALREKLEIPEAHMVLAIGQFIHRKGFDVLMKAARLLPGDVGIYIVGGEATEDYHKLREELGVSNVHFLGFQPKERLTEFYKAADLFALPTREDIWGLVINEALAYGLPTITTDRCVAGLELIRDGINGYIVPVEEEKDLAEKIQAVLDADREAMGTAALEAVRPYTLENMAKIHAQILDCGR